jgi:hypothetical protein
VSFHDDFGSLSAVTYWRLPADRVAALADPAQRDDAYARTLHGQVMRTMFTPVSPRARVLHEEFLGQPGPDREYFAVGDLPEGAPLTNMTEGRRMDAVRALLIFETNGFLYMLEQEIGAGVVGLGQTRPSGAERGTPPDAAALESARDGLHAFRSTISFGSRGRRGAVAQTAGEPTLTDSQRAARLRAWGNGPEVRFAPSRTAQVFQQTSEQFAAAWPTLGAGDGVLDGARVRHPRVATSLPLESDPCRLIWFK